MLQEPPSEALQDITITEEMVEKKLSELKENKAAGADNISPRFLLEVCAQICVPLTRLFLQSLSDGVVPEDWKKANVSPIFKKANKSLAESYRPVSLTSQFRRILESIMRDSFVNHFENHHLIRESQHRFRKGRSCLSNLLAFLDKVSQYTEDGEKVDVIYFNFAKAFDKVPHQRLLQKIRNHGIDRTVLK